MTTPIYNFLRFRDLATLIPPGQNRREAIRDLKILEESYQLADEAYLLEKRGKELVRAALKGAGK